MPYSVTKYPPGTFCWADFFSTDIKASKKFLTDFFGWISQDMPTGEGKPDYTMFSLDGRNVAGGSQAFDSSLPSFWSNYISVESVDEVTIKAVQLGAKVKMEAMDVFDAGRMSVIEDPTGASVSFWQPKRHIGSGIVNTVGAMSWNELYTPDVEKAKQFYAELLGWTYTTDERGYVTIQNKGRNNGGMMQITQEMQGMIPCWIVYFTVKHLDDALTKVKELGGSVGMGPMDIPVGKIAMIADPANAHLMLIEMTVTPEEWSE